MVKGANEVWRDPGREISKDSIREQYKATPHNSGALFAQSEPPSPGDGWGRNKMQARRVPGIVRCCPKSGFGLIFIRDYARSLKTIFGNCEKSKRKRLTLCRQDRLSEGSIRWMIRRRSVYRGE